MGYIEFSPRSELQHLVKCVWLMEDRPVAKRPTHFPPDSYLELVMNCGAPLMVTACEKSLILPDVFVTTLYKHPMTIHATDASQVIVMRLYAWSAPFLTTLQQSQNLPVVPLNGIWQELARTLIPLVQNAENRQAVDIFQQVAGEQFADMNADEQFIRTVHELMYASQGQLSIRAIASRCYLSVNQFERRFKAITGVSPKHFARLVRVEAVRDYLIDQPETPLVDVAYQFGYTDESHLIRDFKAFAQQTPRMFSESLKPQDGDFLQSNAG